MLDQGTHLKARSAGSRLGFPPRPVERTTGARRALGSVHEVQLAVGFNRRRLWAPVTRQN